MIQDIIAAQSKAIEPEAFQSALISGMSSALLRTPSPPCLLRAPTGSGKTFVISRVLENVSASQPTLWLWFVPFINLVQQTEDALAANCTGMTPVMLSRGRNQEARANMVLLSTAQGVAKAKDRLADYNADGDDDMRTLAEFIARARVQGLKIGLVVDEAHIGLDKTTEFGRFANWLNADFLIMATATPRDTRLLEFLQHAGQSAFESFAVSRDEVVNARLNKRYIEAIVYDLRQSVQTVADLKKTVLRQAWKRSQQIKRKLEAAGIPLVPLLLVQVANGDKTVEEAELDLIQICRVPPGAIGKHSSSDPDPLLMAAIANDSSKEVLIFKQSAGTGFDAPRAFVLASTKTVNDADFAMQFIGRVMRVSRQIRDAYPKPVEIPPDFDTAHIYLADAESQQGFESAVKTSSAVKSELEGQTEKLIVKQTISGATTYTNRVIEQTPLMYDLPLPIVDKAPLVEGGDKAFESQKNLFDNFDFDANNLNDIVLDEVVRDSSLASTKNSSEDLPQTASELISMLNQKNIRVYHRNKSIQNLPKALSREQKPEMQNMAEVSKTVATRLEIPEEVKKSAVRAALNKLKEIEVHTELTQGLRHEEDIQIITDRAALSREAQSILRNLPQVEDEDVKIIVGVISQRLEPFIYEAFELLEDEHKPIEVELKRYARDAAFWVIRREAQAISELMQTIVSEHTTIEVAEPLPDLMLFPTDITLSGSRKNIYGVLPPSDDDLSNIEKVLFLDERNWLSERTIELQDGQLAVGKFDGLSKLNREERDFAKALDRADFVVWWHRNPDRKPYAVRVVREEHQNYFYPDFVVCISHVPGDEPVMRLIETKENVKDASRKARRIPKAYGKVLFLTKDNNRLKIVNDDGSLGLSVDWDDLSPVRDWLRATKP